MCISSIDNSNLAIRLKEIVHSHAVAVASLFAFNLICAQLTVPVDVMTIFYECVDTALPFRTNGMSTQRPCNGHAVHLKR